jgi:hypothetical protein
MPTVALAEVGWVSMRERRMAMQLFPLWMQGDGCRADALKSAEAHREGFGGTSRRW